MQLERQVCSACLRIATVQRYPGCCVDHLTSMLDALFIFFVIIFRRRAAPILDEEHDIWPLHDSPPAFYLQHGLSLKPCCAPLLLEIADHGIGL